MAFCASRSHMPASSQHLKWHCTEILFFSRHKHTWSTSQHSLLHATQGVFWSRAEKRGSAPQAEGPSGHTGKSITSDLSRIRDRGQKLGGLSWADPMTPFKDHNGSTDPALTTCGPYCQGSRPCNLPVLTSILQKALLQWKNISLFV